MKKRLAWIAACCLVPVALTLGISFLSLRGPFYWLVSLICPILMVGSMWAMNAPERESSCHDSQERQEVTNR